MSDLPSGPFVAVCPSCLQDAPVTLDHTLDEHLDKRGELCAGTSTPVAVVLVKCAVCNLRLNRINEGWIHALPVTDHPPVPIPDVDLTGDCICDFCSARLTTEWWEYPARSFRLETLAMNERTGETRYADLGSNDEWLVCGDCHKLLEADDRNGLLTRSVDCFFPLHMPDLTVGERRMLSPSLRQATDALHKEFYVNRVGEPTLIRKGRK